MPAFFALAVCLGLASSPPEANASNLIQQAIACEERGQDAQRQHLLELAVEAEPENSTARGLLGQVKLGDRWVREQDASQRVLSDSDEAALRAEYEQRRESIPDTAPAHWDLALWCQAHGLKAESIAHLTQVTRLDPQNSAAWRRLGCRFYHGRWMSPEEIVSLAADLERQGQADRHWLPRLIRWKNWLVNPARRDDAIRELSAIHEPEAVAPVTLVFDGEPQSQRWAVYVLGRIDAPQSAQALARLAVTGLDAGTRDAAIRLLRRLDPRTYVGLLINGIKATTQYQVIARGQSSGEAVVQIEDPRAVIERHYHAVAVPAARSASQGTGSGNGQLVRSGQVSRLQSNGHYALFNEEVRAVAQPSSGSEDSQSAGAALSQRVAADLRQIEESNLPIKVTNSRVLYALKELTGKAFGPDQQVWTRWWTQELGYHVSSSQPVPKPVVLEEVSAPYASPPPPVMYVSQTQQVGPHSCFVAGTLVHTRSGLRPIEDLKIGDQVLAQDATTGNLVFEPVLATLHNPPADVLRLELETGEAVSATDIHRFWLAGAGWKMARELSPGDRLRVLGGTVKVASVSRARRQLVYNLEVARAGSFLVGPRGILVHDATLVAPVVHPFDGQPSRPAGLARAGS